LESLAQQGIGVYRTDLDGSVTVRTNGRTLTVDTAIPR
jgi:beta-lactamase superfamily II metal-dependent hydrolase